MAYYQIKVLLEVDDDITQQEIIDAVWFANLPGAMHENIVYQVDREAEYYDE
jgi:hypothetical protein